MRTPAHRTSARIALLVVLVLSTPVLVACPDDVDDATRSPSEAKNFSADEGCNFKTVGAECSKEHRVDRAVTTGAPVVCAGKKGEPLRWQIDTRSSRNDEWKTAKTPKPGAP